jgi:hypothetical protein
MTKYLQLATLKEKITELQTALFYDLSNSVLKLPVCVINVLSVDDFGQIWFAIPFHFYHRKEFDREFLGDLHFFNKQKEFYLNIGGKAFLVHDPEELNHIESIPDELKKNVLAKELMLIKVKIRTADYFARKNQPAKKDYKHLLNQIYSTFFVDPQPTNLNYKVLYLK